MTTMTAKAEVPNKRLRLVALVQVIEVGEGMFSTARETERTWHQEQIVVPLDRVGALDVQDMVNRALKNVVVIAGMDGKE